MEKRNADALLTFLLSLVSIFSGLLGLYRAGAPLYFLEPLEHRLVLLIESINSHPLTELVFDSLCAILGLGLVVFGFLACGFALTELLQRRGGR